MKLKEYNYNDKTQLTKHFNVQEWKCKCGKHHKIVIANTLPPLLEQVMQKIGAIRGDISSGYRCSEYEKIIGGTGSNTHQGYACDIKFTDKFGKVIDSKYVALALEDLGHNYGIGYKCGSSSLYTHIDVKPRKWYGDESKSMTKTCCNSFYEYFKTSNKKVITYQIFDNIKHKWLPTVKINSSNFAGNIGNPISGLKIDNLKYRVHDKITKKWLPWIIDNTNYAGNLKNSIDGLQVENAVYRVHVKGGKWLPWVSKVDNTNNGYAGIYNKEIDAIQLKK